MINLKLTLPHNHQGLHSGSHADKQLIALAFCDNPTERRYFCQIIMHTTVTYELTAHFD